MLKILIFFICICRLMNTEAIFSQCRYNILLVEYRGYGKSDGSPSEGGKI
jgi:hypothetical protein